MSIAWLQLPRVGKSTAVDTTELAAELGHPDAQELLHNGPLARLAYNGRYGLPRVIPVGFYWNGEHIVVCTAPTSPKVRALSIRPNVALTIDTVSADKSLSVRGIVSMETVDGVADDYLAAAKKTMHGDDLAEFERQVQSTYPQMVRILIEPEWARFYDFGSGRLPAFLAKLTGDG